jgi:hypothetical protein
MLKCIFPTEASKLGVIAATYRSGSTTIYDTCPATCNLLPKKEHGTNTIDWVYFDTELQAVPRQGIAWSYTHFSHTEVPLYDYGTTFNISTDTVEEALASRIRGYPTVYAAPYHDQQWPRRIQGVRFIRCPAELHKHITCQTCGGGEPLCARRNRDYVIVFVAHGSRKFTVGHTQGGCYADTGPCGVQWRSTLAGTGKTTWNETDDPERLLAWIRSLPPKTLLRHRIAGDIGKPKERKIIPIHEHP